MTVDDRFYAAVNVAGVNTFVASRIYPDSVPQEQALPAVAFTRISSEPQVTLGSAVAATRCTFDVWCMSLTRSNAEAIADAVQTACSTAYFVSTGRRQEFDADTETHAAVLTVDVWA